MVTEVHPQLTEVGMVAVTGEATETRRDRAVNPPGGKLLGVLGPALRRVCHGSEKGFKLNVLDKDTSRPT